MLSKEPDKHLEDVRNAWFEGELSEAASVPFATGFSHVPALHSEGSYIWLDSVVLPLPFPRV